MADDPPQHATNAAAAAARSQLMDLYNLSPQAGGGVGVGAGIVGVSAVQVEAVVCQFVGCESELLVELMADPGAIHELLLPDDSDDSDSSSESDND